MMMLRQPELLEERSNVIIALFDWKNNEYEKEGTTFEAMPSL